MTGPSACYLAIYLHPAMPVTARRGVARGAGRAAASEYPPCPMGPKSGHSLVFARSRGRSGSLGWGDRSAASRSDPARRCVVTEVAEITGLIHRVDDATEAATVGDAAEDVAEVGEALADLVSRVVPGEAEGPCRIVFPWPV